MDVDAALEALEAIVEDRGLLAELPPEVRKRLLVAAGRASRPETHQERRLARAFREERVVVAQTWLYHADLIGGLAARMAGIPVAWGIHNSTLHGNASGRGLRMVIRACRWLSPVVPSGKMKRTQAPM